MKKNLLILWIVALLSSFAFVSCGGKKETANVVKFVTNEGTAVKSVSVKVGESLDLSDVLTEKDGMYFIGWYLDEELTVPASNHLTPEGNVTLYARWGTEETFTLTFDSQGGSAVAAQEYLGGAYLKAPEAPTNGEMVFGGWYYDADCTEVFNFIGFTMPKKDMTVYAKWVEPETEEEESQAPEAEEEVSE